MAILDTISPYVSDILMATAALAAAIYCMILARRITRLSRLDEGVGGAIASLSTQVDEMQALLNETRKSTEKSRADLAATTEQAQSIAHELELLIAACHDVETRPKSPIDKTPPEMIEAAAPVVRPDTQARGAGEDAAPPLAGADRDLTLAIDRSAPEYPPKFQTAAERAPNLPNVTRDAHDLIEPQDPPNGVYSGGQAASVVPNIAPLAAPSPLTITSQAQPVFAAQIGAQIDRHIAATPIAPNSTGVTEFTLNPPELGRLRMVISNSEAGAMSLTILADRPEVADLMRRHSQILVQEFMREGLNHTAIKIEASAPAAQTATPTVPQASSGPQGLNLWADAHAQGQNPQRQNPQSHHNQQDRPVPDEPRSVVGAGVDARAIMVAAPIPTTRTLDLRL